MNPAQYILIAGVQAYRVAISPAKTFLFGSLSQCRFTPSCSVYAQDAIRHHGVLAGCWLALKRIARCHPWGGCGEDPVPPPPAAGSPGNGEKCTRPGPSKPSTLRRVSTFGGTPAVLAGCARDGRAPVSARK